MKNYELMYILKPSLEEGVLKAEKENVSKLLTTNGCNIGKIEELGLKDLAYEIKKERKGYYVVLNFETENVKALDQVKKQLTLNTNVIRFLIIRK